MNTSPLSPGVWGVVATPFAGAGLEVDKMSLRQLAEHYQRTGVCGLTVLGVFGEAAQLTRGERATVLETVAEAVQLPLVVGATALGTAPVVEEIRFARQVVGDRMAAMVQVNSAAPEVLTTHLRTVHDATGTGLVVQDYPLISGVQVSVAALAAALRALPFVVAVKAEAQPTPVVVSALTGTLDVPVFGGLGGLGLLDELAAGAAGAMTGFSWPEGLVDCVTAYLRSGYAAAREAWLPYLPLVNFEQQAKIALGIRKECLRQRGLIRESGVRPPAPPMPDVLGVQLRRHLDAVAHTAGVS